MHCVLLLFIMTMGIFFPIVFSIRSGDDPFNNRSEFVLNMTNSIKDVFVFKRSFYLSIEKRESPRSIIPVEFFMAYSTVLTMNK